MSDRKTYKVVCPELEMLLHIKRLKPNEEQKLYENLRNKIQEETNIDIYDFKLFVIKQFLVDSDEFFELRKADPALEIEAVLYAYDAILKIYPIFSLEFICNDLNSETFFDDASNQELLQRVRKKLLGEEFAADPAAEQGSVALSSLEELRRLEEHLRENIVGQDAAITALMRCLKLMASGLSNQSSFLFVGPTGVGKTQLAKLLGEKFSGNFYKINCAEYAGGHEYAKLIGSPPGYIGHSERSLLAEKAEKSNSWVFLFDEIEKAHHKLYDFLLSLLDDGTCTDNMGQVLDFSKSVFIFTSNQGISDIKRESVGFLSSKEEVSDVVTESVIRKSVKKHFSPEFLNRIDDIVVFKPLSRKEVKDIAALHLEQLPIFTTNSLVEFVADKGYSREYGARNIARFIKNNVSDKVADAILNELVPKEGEFYKPRIVKGEVKIVDTQKYNVSSN